MIYLDCPYSEKDIYYLKNKLYAHVLTSCVMLYENKRIESNDNINTRYKEVLGNIRNGICDKTDWSFITLQLKADRLTDK